MTLFLFVLTSPGAYAESRPEAWSIWSVSDEAVETTIDHSAWGEFLERYVQAHEGGINFIAYADVDANDRKSLQAYLERLTDAPSHLRPPVLFLQCQTHPQATQMLSGNAVSV